MTQTYTRPANKSTTTNENISKKEISFKQNRENRIKPGFFRVIPSHVCDDPNLNSTHRDIYGLINALCSNQGFCDYENWEFAEYLRISDSTFKRALRHLRLNGLVFIEMENQFKRKLYTFDTHHAKQRISKNVSPGQICTTPRSNLTRYINKIDKSFRKDNTEKHTPPPSAIIPFFYFKDKTTAWLTREEYEKLVNDYGQDQLDITISEMRAWDSDKKSGNGFKRTNFCKKIRKWHEDRIRKFDDKNEKKKEAKKSRYGDFGNFGDLVEKSVEDQRIEECEKTISKFLSDNQMLKDFQWNKGAKLIVLKHGGGIGYSKSVRYPEFYLMKFLEEWKKSHE